MKADRAKAEKEQKTKAKNLPIQRVIKRFLLCIYQRKIES